VVHPQSHAFAAYVQQQPPGEQTNSHNRDRFSFLFFYLFFLAGVDAALGKNSSTAWSPWSPKKLGPASPTVTTERSLVVSILKQANQTKGM
jgi:hypothetical protein